MTQSQLTADGQFGAMMAVSLTNDGPVTIIFDSKDRQGSSRSARGSGASTPRGQPQPPPKGSAEAEEIAKAKIAAKKAKKAEWEARKARGEIPAKGAFARGEIPAAKDKVAEVQDKVKEMLLENGPQ
jgi:D-tyrosyl-tRNA(Tyr) deacylase